jgi:hypothetical protein
MPRPKKIGLDYFPLDTNFDEKIQALESLFGNDGLVWQIKAWQTAYRNEFGEVNTSSYFGEVLAKNSRVTTEKQQEIIKFCLDIKLLKEIEPEKYTSDGIQKRISAVSKERACALKRYENKAKEIRVKKRESKVKVIGHTSPKYFSPPIFDEVKKYFIDNGYSEQLADRFFKGYAIADWKDSNGRAVKNWKQKALHVWFKPEGKNNGNNNRFTTKTIQGADGNSRTTNYPDSN